MDEAGTSQADPLDSKSTSTHDLNLLCQRSIGRPNKINCLINNVKRRNCSNLTLAQNIYVQRDHRSNIFAMQLDCTSEQKYLLCGSTDGSLCIIDVDGSYEPTGKRVCKVVGGVSRQSRHAHGHMVSNVCWYPFDTGMFATSSTDCFLKIWDTNRLKPVEKIGFGKALTHHEWSTQCPQMIAVASSSSNVRLIDIRTGSIVQQVSGVHKSIVNCVAWSLLDGHLLVTAGADGILALWDVRSSKSSLGQFSDKADVKKICQESVSEIDNPTNLTNLQILAAKRAVKRKIDERERQSVPSARAHTGEAMGLKFTNDGLFLVSLGSEGRIKLWDYSKLKKKDFTRKHGVLPLNNGRKMIHFDTSQHICSTSPGVAFIPVDDDIEKIDLLTGTVVGSLKGHFNSVNSCVYRQCTQELFSAANDRNILCWAGPKLQNPLLIDQMEYIKNIRSDDWSDND